MPEKQSLPPEKLGLAFALARPRVPVLITSENADGSTNVMPMNWNAPISVSPPLLLLAFEYQPKTSDTLLNIRRTGECVVNMPSLALADRLVLASYEHAPDVSKFDAIGFTPLPSRHVRPPGIADARAVLECRAVRIIDDLGDHHLVVAQVLAAAYDPEAYEADLTSRVSEASQPCVHLGQSREEAGQTHAFLTPSGVTRIWVPYPARQPER